jgi:hypothetical protein
MYKYCVFKFCSYFDILIAKTTYIHTCKYVYPKEYENICNVMIGHLSQRELFLIDRIQQLERIILVSSMPECDHEGDGSPDKKKRRK